VIGLIMRGFNEGFTTDISGTVAKKDVSGTMPPAVNKDMSGTVVASTLTMADLTSFGKTLKDDILSAIKVQQPVVTPALQQGKEFRGNTCADPDYIRKDSIPCWGCKL
jgi:hypothetical protein